MLDSYLHEKIMAEEMLPAQVNIIKGTPGRYTPYHWHRSIEVNYLMECDVEIYINGKEYIASDDFLLIVNSGDIHQVRSISPKKEKAISLIISYDFLKERFSQIDDFEFSLENGAEKVDEMKGMLKELYELFEEKRDPFYLWKGNALIYQIIYCLFSYFGVRKRKEISLSRTEKYRERFKKIIEYINEHYKEDLSQDTVAKFCGVSREHLARNFKKYMGTTFKEYLDSIRLHYAYMALLNTDYSILEIALDSGFGSEKALARCFSKQYGMSPSRYRKNYKR